MESENQDSASPELPPRIPKRLNMGEEFAKTISSELNSRLSSIRTSGNSATPSRISTIQYDAPPMPPKRGDVRVSDENLDDYDIPGENEDAPPIPPRKDASPPLPPRRDASPPLPPRRGENVRVSDENLEDFDLPDDNAPPPPVPPRGADVKVSDENLDDYDIPSESAPPPALPPRKDDLDDDVPPPIPARTYHRFEENEETPAKEAKQEIDTSDELKKMVQKLEKELKEKEETISSLKTENNRLCGEIKSLKDEKRSSDDKIKKLKSENESLKSENSRLRSDIESIKEKNKQLKIDIESASKQQAQTTSPTKSPTKSVKSPSKVAPVIPPKPSRKTCESMIQNANSISNDEYDFSGNKESSATSTKENEDEIDTKDNSNSSSLNGSIELLPGTSSRPLVLPTKSCVRKRGNRLSSAITERKSSKRVTSTLVEEPNSLDNDSPVSASPMSSRKTSDAPPPLPSRSSLSVDNSELKSRLEKMSRNTIDEDPEISKDETPSKKKEEEEDNEKEVEEDNADEEIKENDHEKEEIVKSPTSAGAKEEGGEEEEAEEEPEINPTLSRIHRIGVPSLIPEGGLSSIKLRSRRREDSHSAHQFERLDEESLKKWIFATVKKDEVDGSLFDILHDGQLLCELINVIRPEKQIVAKKGKMRPWHIVNINAYLNGCVDLRIKTIFKAEDLYEGEGLDKIIDNLSELKFYADNKK